MNTDGGPAFPLAAHDDVAAGGSYHTQQGMSLRDWFAGQALAGLMAGYQSGPMGIYACAQVAIETADAMLRARDGVKEVERNDAEDDEAWLARQSKRCIHTAGDGMSWASCEAGERIVTAGGFSRAAAIRALRAKVEGGAQ